MSLKSLYFVLTITIFCGFHNNSLSQNNAFEIHITLKPEQTIESFIEMAPNAKIKDLNEKKFIAEISADELNLLKSGVYLYRIIKHPYLPL